MKNIIWHKSSFMDQLQWACFTRDIEEEESLQSLRQTYLRAKTFFLFAKLDTNWGLELVWRKKSFSFSKESSWCLFHQDLRLCLSLNFSKYLNRTCDSLTSNDSHVHNSNERNLSKIYYTLPSELIEKNFILK